MDKNKFVFCLILIVAIIFSSLATINAYYLNEIYFTLPNTVYTTSTRIEFSGFLTQANYSSNGTLISSAAALPSAVINITLTKKDGTFFSNYTLTTDSQGSFYSKSNYFPNATEINTSTIAGNYYVNAQYIDAANATVFSKVEFAVINQTIDSLKISSDKAFYNPSEGMQVSVEALRQIGDKLIQVSNVSINGSIRNSSKYALQTFNCTTGANGKCILSLSAPSNYGSYILELNNFKTFGSFYVVPFSFNTYMKDELGKSLKNVYAIGEQGRVEVSIINSTSTDIYTFSGYIADSAGNVVKSITSTQLDSNNSFTNTFLFTVDALTYSYGAYKATITVTKTGSTGSVTAYAGFQVQDWSLSINRKDSNSGFEYDYSVFPNKTIYLEAIPSYRSNGTVIPEINSTFFSIQLKDTLNNILVYANTTWNGSCGKSGCYEFSLKSPITAGQYTLYATLANGGSIQKDSKLINVIAGVMSGQSTDANGATKELFGTNEYAYISLNAYNLTSAQYNLTDAEIFLVSFMNGTEFSYTQVNTFDLVNASNIDYEWAWNSSLQRIKLDIPKIGGLYNLYLYGNNRTLGATARIIVNPYDMCMTPKDTPGTVSAGNYYVWQFKTSDTIYFEIKLTQANNPLGKATALNSSLNGTSNNSFGMGGACNVDTTIKQVINNATLTVTEARNLESGSMQNINTTASTCQASDNLGGYSCTVKPLNKWNSGVNIVKFNIQGQDGTTSIGYSRFEARSFYLYGYSLTWQNNPESNITLNVQLYEAGSSWWSNYGSSGGLSGTLTVKKIEYQGRDGEWIWPPISYGYNVSNISSASVTSGTGSISLPAALAPGGNWKTGYYRAIIQATTSSGDSDYGYAWFGIKLWDVYGSPVECTSTGCNYKNYFNSRENITLYIKIGKAGDYNYNAASGQSIGGNVTIGVKKITDCRTWPCKELNSSQYKANTINVNQSSPWYWNANSGGGNQSGYIIQINTTSGTWNTGYYSVTLDVNGTDTGNAWFNTIAFYIETQPTNVNGSDYKYSIRGNSPMYFNVTTVKSYKQGYWYGNTNVKYNISDYINTTLYDAVLRTWDQQTNRAKEYNYPEDINIAPRNVTGNGVLNITFNNGTWPTGYYYGELILKNSVNETSTGWLWFNVQPFRVQITSNSYSIDTDQCINATVSIYDSDWAVNTLLVGNYSILKVNENIWSGMSGSVTEYTNFTTGNFNSTKEILFCPNANGWSGGNWGGYHYLNVVVKDNAQNDTQTGWLSFRTVPFQITWGSIIGGTSKLTNATINVSVSLRKASGANISGNLTKIYQWRYDNFRSTKEEYTFSVGSCSSAVSGQCTINGTQTVIISAPSVGWKVGYNYLQAEWTKQNDPTTRIDDWSGIYFEGKEAYNGYFSNSDVNGWWKHDFRDSENITIKLYTKDSNYNPVNITITNVEYAYSGSNCWNDACRTYTSATFSPTTTSSGEAVIHIKVPSTGWTKGEYYIRASVSGASGSAIITQGNVRVKDMTPPNVTISLPLNNATYNITNFSFSATTTKNSQCSIQIVNYNNFYNWYCSGWNATSNNATNGSISQQKIGACNMSYYNYNGNTYYSEYIANNYHSTYNGSISTWSSGTFLNTGGRTHTYNINTTDWTAQHYGLQVWCYDEDWNYAAEVAAFKVNVTV